MGYEVLNIFSNQLSPRLLYTLDVIFRDILGTTFTITTNSKEFDKYQGPKIAYSDQSFPNAFSIKPIDLLFESGIREVDIEVDRTSEIPRLFSHKKTADINFDVFSATFYLVSRYEEYLPHRTDKHDRYMHTESIAWRYGFLMKPVVNHWVLELANALKEKFPSFQYLQPQFTFTPTFDVDDAYFLKNQPFSKQILSLLGSLKKGDKKLLKEKWKILTSDFLDPYDTFEASIMELMQENIRPIFFVLMGNYGGFDNAIDADNLKFRGVIKAIADYCDIGIHPSYASNLDESLLENEIQELNEILHRPIVKSRQHYLKIKLPGTYQKLINKDIKEDYSMAYAGFPGFRASIATPYYFYDLDYEKKTNLLIYPTSLMDGTLKNYLKLSTTEAEEWIIQIIQEIKNVNGTFISLWHNNSISDFGEWEGWQAVYRFMIKNSVKKSEGNSESSK